MMNSIKNLKQHNKMANKTFNDWIRLLVAVKIAQDATQKAFDKLIKERSDHVSYTTGYFIRTPYPRWDELRKKEPMVDPALVTDFFIKSKPIDFVKYTPHHIDIIICPGCQKIQDARVEHTFPWPSYVHECVSCQYIIMESEWEQANPIGVFPTRIICDEAPKFAFQNPNHELILCYHPQQNPNHEPVDSFNC